MRAQRIYAGALHLICILTTITHAPRNVITTMHFANMSQRFALFCIGVCVFARTEYFHSSGIVIQEYGYSAWETTTGQQWRYGDIPGAKIVAQPGNIFAPVLWMTIVTTLLLYDLIRGILIMRGRWNANTNHQDLTWTMTSSLSIPLLFISTALALGHKDVSVLILIFVLAMFSGVCSAIVEEMRTLVNTENILGLPGCVLLVRITHDVLITLAAQVTCMPFVYNSINSEEDVSPTKILTAFTIGGLVLVLTSTQYRYNRLCSIFEQTWPSKCSTTKWGAMSMRSTNPQRTILQSNFAYPDDIVVQPKELAHHTTVRDQSGKVKKITPTEGPEASFKTLYGCHMDNESISADEVYITGQDNKIVTVKLTDDFNMYNQLHNPRVPQDHADLDTMYGRAPKGMHVAYIGVGAHVFHTYLDEDGHITRQMIGHLTEWRRYYLTNILINTLLVSNLFAMTGYPGQSDIH
jgi:hypothetical protein